MRLRSGTWRTGKGMGRGKNWVGTMRPLLAGARVTVEE